MPSNCYNKPYPIYEVRFLSSLKNFLSSFTKNSNLKLFLFQFIPNWNCVLKTYFTKNVHIPTQTFTRIIKTEARNTPWLEKRYWESELSFLVKDLATLPQLWNLLLLFQCLKTKALYFLQGCDHFTEFVSQAVLAQ